MNFKEEECLVPLDWPADSPAKNMLLQLCLPQIVEVVLELAGVQAWGAIKPEAVAVEIVAAGLGDHRHLPAGVASVFSGVVARQQAKFAKHVGVDAERCSF